MLKKLIAIVLSVIVVITAFCFLKKDKESVEIMPFDKIDSTKWSYDENADIWWQAGLTYCEKPADTTYQTLGIYVPGKYMTGEKNEDGYYTCSLTNEAVEGYTAETAPVVMPVNTPGYSAMKAPAGFEKRASEYTKAGFIYVNAGCRGRDHGAPAGVTDLKAAVRFIRWNKDSLPGDTEKIFTFGHSGGGAQSSLMGATGDSEMYMPYLEVIGAVMTESDAVFGAMCWCPITALDTADGAYEWNMGATRTELSADEKELSNALSKSYADYINALCLKDEGGRVLSLENSDNGIFQSGSYYDYICSAVAAALDSYITENGENIETYISENCSDFAKYENGEITVTDLSAFAKKYKNANKDICAFDGLESQQTENVVFSIDGKSLHFNKYLYEIVKETEYEAAFAEDFTKTDAQGKTVEYRENMYNPMYFICEYYNGYGTSTVAPNWRIRSGIEQGDTALTVEINLALALNTLGKNVDFATVWGEGHTEAEITGTSSENFISWVNECCK